MKNTVLDKIESRVIKGKEPLVVLSLRDWKIIEDVIYETSSPQLLKSIEESRRAYKKGKAVAYKPA